MSGVILVGVDGEPSHRAALDWAAHRAAAGGSRLELAFVVERGWGDLGDEPVASVERAAEVLLAAESERAARAGDIPVTTRPLYGHVGAELVAAAQDADLLVVGARGPGDGRFAGSLAVRAAATAPCPVAIVPHGWHGSGPGSGVVVGVDGERPAEVAVAFAADEAAALGEPLTIVCAGFVANPLLAGLVPERTLGDRRERVVAAAVRFAREQRPGLDVRPLVVEAAPAHGLVEAARGARMLVVGTRNRRGMSRLLLGSVSHDVLLNPRVPVVVVREREG